MPRTRNPYPAEFRDQIIALGRPGRLYPIHLIAKILGVSCSGFYAHQDREPSARGLSDAELVAQIKLIHRASQEIYGAPRIHAELADNGVKVGRKRVERLMKAHSLRDVSRRRFVCTTTPDKRHCPARDLVDRNLTAEGPNRLLVADLDLFADLSLIDCCGFGCLQPPHRGLGHDDRPQSPASRDASKRELPAKRRSSAKTGFSGLWLLVIVRNGV
ncbi:MAG: IS3 family transposase [Pseudomonadota bacterium]